MDITWIFALAIIAVLAIIGWAFYKKYKGKA